MSYTFLLEQGEESSAECFSAIPACVLSRSIPTADESYSSASETEYSHGSRSGTTLEPSTEPRGEGALMLCAAASPARTLARPAKARELKEAEADYGWKWQESFVKYDLDTHSWRTRQSSLLEDLDVYSETWPRWGWMRGGECLVLSMPEHLIDESESGLWPTPVAHEGGAGADPSKRGRKLHIEVQRRWPTPTARDWKDGTAQACANVPENSLLGRAVHVRHKQMFPTPNSTNGTRGAGKPERWKRRHQINLEDVAGGALNPTWVEWLMGWPLGWTALEPLAMDKFQQWLRSHGVCSEVEYD